MPSLGVRSPWQEVIWQVNLPYLSGIARVEPARVEPTRFEEPARFSCVGNMPEIAIVIQELPE